MMVMQRAQQPCVAGIDAIAAVFLLLGWCLKAKEFWWRGRGPLLPCVRGPCEVMYGLQDKSCTGAARAWKSLEHTEHRWSWSCVVQVFKLL
jgi:hypothetical protein